MKITDIKATTVTVPLEAPLRHANGCHWGRFVRTIVEVETDEGITGYGECTLEGREKAVVGVVEDFRRHLVGEPAFHIRRLFRRMTRHGYWEAGPVVSSGAGGIEMALWDILGKFHGTSVASLLGGPACRPALAAPTPARESLSWPGRHSRIGRRLER